ncbi:MAG: hypothetical protein KGQ54_01990 [Verrucomicrobia bacterium]|nr:hypothetical protein [Verrucomicrobiota bacterium]
MTRPAPGDPASKWPLAPEVQGWGLYGLKKLSQQLAAIAPLAGGARGRGDQYRKQAGLWTAQPLLSGAVAAEGD